VVGAAADDEDVKTSWRTRGQSRRCVAKDQPGRVEQPARDEQRGPGREGRRKRRQQRQRSQPCVAWAAEAVASAASRALATPMAVCPRPPPASPRAASFERADRDRVWCRRSARITAWSTRWPAASRAGAREGVIEAATVWRPTRLAPNTRSAMRCGGRPPSGAQTGAPTTETPLRCHGQAAHGVLHVSSVARGVSGLIVGENRPPGRP
jgi:hypothetical protein